MPGVLRPLATLFASLAILDPAVAATDTTYTVTALRSLGGDVTHPTFINDRGMITGQSTRKDDDRRGVAFFAFKKKMVGLKMDHARSPTRGLGVNAAGVVVGYETTTDFVFGHPVWPFAWTQEGGKTLLPAYTGSATAIGDDGVVVGWSGPSADVSLATSWKDGVATVLGSAGGWPCSAVSARNAAGDMVGWVGSCPFASDPQEHAMARFDGTMQDLGTFGFYAAEATAVNASRLVAGNVTSRLGDWGFVWQDGIARILRGPEGAGATAVRVRAVDDAGRVVGLMRLPGRRDNRDRTHAFLWQAGTWVDLNDRLAPGTTGWVLHEAMSINARGEIVGEGEKDHVRVGFKLTPVR